MRKSLLSLSVTTLSLAAALLLALPAQAQLGKAASEATESAKQKIDQKRAESAAKEGGPVDKAVNNVKAKVHEHKSKAAAENAKDAITGKK